MSACKFKSNNHSPIATTLEAAKRSHAIYRAYQELLPPKIVPDSRQSLPSGGQGEVDDSAMQDVGTSISISIPCTEKDVPCESKIEMASALAAAQSASELLEMLKNVASPHVASPSPQPHAYRLSDKGQTSISTMEQQHLIDSGREIDEIKSLCIYLKFQLKSLFEWKEQLSLSEFLANALHPNLLVLFNIASPTF